MMRASFWCAVAMLVFGCESGEVPVRGARKGYEPIRYVTAEKTPREPAETPRPEEFFVDLADDPEETNEKVDRDLAAELKAAIGTPTACLTDFTVSSPTKLRINVTATIRPTGMVITP